MQVQEIRTQGNVLTELRFIHTDEADFKDAIKTYMQAHHPMTWQEFFERLEEFHSSNICRLNMQ